MRTWSTLDVQDMENVNPRVFKRAANRLVLEREEDDTVHDEIDSREIFGKYSELGFNLVWGTSPFTREEGGGSPD